MGRENKLNKLAQEIETKLKSRSDDLPISTTILRGMCNIKSNSSWQKLFDSGLIDQYKIKIGKTKVVWQYKPETHKIIKPEQARTQSPESPLEHALRERLVQVERELSNIKTCSGRLDLFNAEIKELIQAIPPYFSQYQPQKLSKVSSPVVACLQLCDWQIGQVIDKHMTNFFGVYNYNLAVDRAFDLVDSFINWIDVQRSGYIIREAVVIVNGDMINGDLRKSSTITNEWPTPGQQVRCANLLSETLRRIACHFEKVTVEYVVPDNHSRNTKRFEPTAAGLNSNNLPVAELTRLHLRDIENIEFKIHLEIQARILINGIPYLAEHGHGVRSNLGYPWYAMGHKIGREAKKRMLTPRTFTKLIIAHFHTPMLTPDFMVGASLCGTSENDAAHGRHYPPAQTAWLVHPKHREFNWLDFRLADFDNEEEEWYDWVNDLPDKMKDKIDKRVRDKAGIGSGRIKTNGIKVIIDKNDNPVVMMSKSK